ncbi:MAG: 4-(cytidine 5'-diphospho)-2-C-methyl-D-erythritol kinase [Verrucomicrobia bacterium]|nr:4-(cytidine 5'-diphospho)-2-C-methyl-D-erythritol kinase [Verrucomicrobiota bacterium]
MLTLRAPAKINLSLRVLRRREDGFHDIESLMCPLELADEIDLDCAGPAAGGATDTPGVEFSCDDASLPSDGSNLAVRAAVIFLRHTGLQGKHGVRVALRKRVPHGAGLGGGSSDAASVLLGLDALFSTNLKLDALTALAAELGSDVPLFLHRSAAICRGRGERVEPLKFPARLPLLLLKPAFGVPTPWAYGRWRHAREIPGVSYAPQPFGWGELVNDLERPVFEKYLLLAAMKEWLLEQKETVAGALLSGSGATVLAVLRDGASASTAEELARRAQTHFGTDFWSCHTHTVAPS